MKLFLCSKLALALVVMVVDIDGVSQTEVEGYHMW